MAAPTAHAKAIISADDSSLQRTLNRAQRGLTTFSSRGARGFDTVSRAGLKLAGTLSRIGVAAGLATAAIATLTLREAANEIGEFGEAISRVEGLTGLESTSEAFTALREEARALGSETQFSATQAADGMAFLAQAGFKANEILDASGDFLNLAAAGSLELAEAMDIASNVMSGFALPATEAARVSDVLADAQSAANTNVSQLGEAMKQVAPIASQLGIDIEQSAAAIGVLGNAAIQGSDAGTALRNILLRLSAGGSEVEKGLGDLNLTLKEVSPATNTLTELFGKFGTAAEAAGLTADETAASFSKIFGTRATAAGLVLVGASDQLGSLTDRLNQADGAAARMAETFTDNLPGDIKRFQSALAELFITAGDAGAEANFRNIAAAATDFVRELGDSKGLERFINTVSIELDGALTLISNRLDAVNFDEVFDSLSDTFLELKSTARTLADSLGDVIGRFDFDNALSASLDSLDRLITAFGGVSGETVNVADAITRLTDVIEPFAAVAGSLTRVVVDNAAAIVTLGIAFKGMAIVAGVTRGVTALTSSIKASSASFAAYRAQIAATNGALAANVASSRAAAGAAGLNGAAAGAAYGARFAAALSLAGPAITAAIIGWGIGKTLDEQFDISENIANAFTGANRELNRFGETSGNIAIDLQNQVQAAETIRELRAAERDIIRGIEDLQAKIVGSSGRIQDDYRAQVDLAQRLLDNMDRFEKKIITAEKQGKSLGETLRTTSDILPESLTVTFDADTSALKQKLEAIQDRELHLKITADAAALQRTKDLLADPFDSKNFVPPPPLEDPFLKKEREELQPTATPKPETLNVDPNLDLFKEFGEFNLNTIRGLEGALREKQREIGNLDFDSDEFAETSAEIQELKNQLSGLNQSVGGATVTLDRLTDAALEQSKGIASGADALENRFNRLSDVDRGQFGGADDFKRQQEDPLSFLRDRDEVDKINRERDIDKALEKRDELDNQRGRDSLLDREIDKLKDNDNKKDPPEDDRGVAERELDKLKNREGLLNADRRRQEEERQQREAGKLQPKPEDKAPEQDPVLGRVLTALRGIDRTMTTVKENTGKTYEVLNERLPSKSI
jgi:TP901 family phage tail tape measure protein